MIGVTWITNLAAPYRIPVWMILGESVDLSVKTIVTEKSFSRDAKGRGSEWRSMPNGLNFFQMDFRSKRVPWIKRPINLLVSLGEVRNLMSSKVIVLTGWEDPIYWQLLLLCKLTGRSTVGFYESILATQVHKDDFFSRLRSLFFRSLDAVVTPGISATEAIEAMGVDAKRIFQGFNAIDVELFSRGRSDIERPQKSGHRYVFVGRLIPLKNVDRIIRAFREIAGPKDVLTIVGEGESRDALEALVQKLELSGQVIFRGALKYENLPSEMKEHHTLVLVSSSEVWGLVINEALAAGLHVVVGRNCGAARSVESMNGVFLTENMVENISDSMKLSRDNWSGPISNPDLLEFTPGKFAECFKEAIDFSLTSKLSKV